MKVLNWTTVDEVIAKFLSDNDVRNTNIRYDDIYNWIAEALKKIGVYPFACDKITGKDVPLLEINNYKARIPCDCLKINQIGYSASEKGPFSSVNSSTGNFDSTYTNDDIGESHDSDPLMYSIRSPYIEINRSTGFILMSYKSLRTDNEGFPMIPDLESVKEALYWYLEMKDLYPKVKRKDVDSSFYTNAKREWSRCCQNAYGELMLPGSDDEMQSLMNVFYRMIPEINAHRTGFKYENQQEQLYLNL